MSDEEDAEWKSDGSSRREVFLCIKQGLALEVDVQHGRERSRLELSSLARLEATEASWTRGVREEWGEGEDVLSVFLLRLF